MKLVYGTKLFAGQPFSYYKIAEKLGHEVSFYNYASNRFGYDQGVVLPRSYRERKRIYDQILEERPDAVHFWQSGILSPYVGDRTLLREYEGYLSAGINVYHRFTGFDLRLPDWDSEINPYSVFKFGYQWPFLKHVDLDRYKRFLSDLFALDVNFCVGDSELAQFLPKPPFVTPRIYLSEEENVSGFFLKEEKYSESILKTNKLRVVHAPSNPLVKGSRYVSQAVDKLKRDGFDIELKMLSGVSHEEVIKAIKESDLLIDQLHIGAPGVFTLEGWRYGKPVACYFNDSVISDYSGDCPVVNVNPESIYDVLSESLKKPETLAAAAEAGCKVFDSYHSIGSIERNMANLYKQKQYTFALGGRGRKQFFVNFDIKNRLVQGALNVSAPDKLGWSEDSKYCFDRFAKVVRRAKKYIWK